MTDSIDIDDLGIEEESTDEGPNRGDWFWRGDGDPADETGPDEGEPSDATSPSTPEAAEEDPTEAAAADATAGAAEEEAEATDVDPAANATGGSIPRVPRTDDDRPVGIPKAGGGAGGTAAKDRDEDRAELTEAEQAGTGPHGGGADDMTTAYTLRALRRLEDLQGALRDAAGWSDWIGIVGDVDAHVINKFQRDNRIDADFFNGTGTGPGERLAEIDPHSMFYADRMVVVGCADESWIAEAADWEFVPVEDAAEGAGWDLTPV